MLRHPAVLVSFALTAWMWLLPTVTTRGARYVALHIEDHATQNTVLILAAGTLLAANLIALRSHRHHTDTVDDLLALPRWRRSVAVVLATVPVAMIAAAIVATQIGIAFTATDVIGRLNPFELLTGPVLVLVAGTLRVCLARLVRSAIVAPLAIVIGVATWLAPFLGLVPDAAASFGLVVTPTFLSQLFGPLPPSLLGRPAGAHVVYLAGIGARDRGRALA